MPVIIVEMWEGRSEEQKRRLVKSFTEAMIEHADVKNPDALHVIFHDTPKNSWGYGGKLCADMDNH